MKYLSLAAAIAFAAARPAWAGDPTVQLDQAVQRVGTVAATTLRITGSIKYYDPEQSKVPGGEPRYGTDATFTQWRDVSGGRSRTEWHLDARRPYPVQWHYVEVIDAHQGFVFGKDSMLPIKPNLPDQQAGHVMSRTRVAINEREFLRTAPDLLQRMAQDRAHVARAADLPLGKTRLPALRYTTTFGDMVVGFDPKGGLPAMIRVRDYDPIQADSDFDLLLSDWRDVGGWRYPFEQRYVLNGKPVATVQLTSVQAEAAPAEAFDHPTVTAAAERPIATDSYQWFIRKQGFAVLMDSDAIYYDPQQSEGMKFVSLAPSVWLAAGGFYNSLVVELKDSLVVYDAPHEAHAQAVLAELARRFPGKRVSHLILTHHHMDHAGGLRSYGVAGATLVVGAGLKQHYADALRRPATLSLPVLNTPQARAALTTAKIIEVNGPFSLGDEDGVRAQAYPVLENLHADGMLFGYVPQARLGFVSDIWSPGLPLPPANTEPRENMVTLARSVQHWKLDPERFAGGHGSVDGYAPVAALLH